MYNFEGERIFSVLPDEVAEEDNDEVVVSSDEATEHSDVLGDEMSTRMASMTISILWLACGSYNLL